MRRWPRPRWRAGRWPARGRRRWRIRIRRARRSSACAGQRAVSRRNGRPGPTASRCANSTSTTPSSPPTTRIPATTSRRSWRWRSIAASTAPALVRGLATGYEIQVDLVTGICLHEHKIDHIAHLGPSAAAGIGAVLGLDAETIYQAVQQALHVTTTTRQSRKGEIRAGRPMRRPSPARWRSRRSTASCAARARRRRSMRARTASSPGCSAGRRREYQVPLPEPGEAKRAILETYTKEHSAEYQSQALIDLARRMGPKVREKAGDLSKIESIVIHTSHHTHYVIGTGANDPQKMDPKASRETLDHSIMYIFAVALEDGGWHHERSYAPERADRPDTVALWHKISHGRGPGMDAALSQPRSEGTGIRRARRRHARTTADRRGRDGGGRRASARRAAVRPRAIYRQVPHAGRGHHRAGRAGPLPRPGRAACRS